MIHFRLLPALLCGSALIPVAALADVTADDVLANMMAPARAFGFDVTAEPVRDGQDLSVESVVMTYALPLDGGEARIVTNGLNLSEQGDGSVRLSYPAPLTMQVSLSTPDTEEAFAATITYEGFDGRTIATGTPGQVSYEGAYDEARFTLSDVTVPDESGFDMRMDGTMSGSSRYEITEGDVVKVVLSGVNDRMQFVSEITDPAGAVTRADQTMTGGTSGMEISIPAGQVDLLNLDDALRAGLMVVAQTADIRVDSENVSRVEDVEIRQTTGYLMDSNDMTLGAEGLSLAGVYTDFVFEFLMPSDMPLPISGEVARSEGRITAPLTETDGAVPVSLRMTLEDLSVNDEIWTLFDPEAQLPRDPMTLVLDMAGEAALTRDPLDIMRMMDVDLMTESLGRIENVVLNEFLLQAVGAEVTGEGAFEIDNDDYETFAGMPAPSGSVDLRVTGANGLLDRLVALGLLPEEQAMGTRMMLGMFGQAGEGEDVITSTIEVTEDGQVLANGQRLR
ncbi:MAG: DUF2125 domain-containing protein [Roseovarius sp.]